MVYLCVQEGSRCRIPGDCDLQSHRVIRPLGDTELEDMKFRGILLLFFRRGASLSVVLTSAG